MKKFFLLGILCILTNSHAMQTQLDTIPDELLVSIIKGSLCGEQATTVLSKLRNLDLINETFHRIVRDKSVIKLVVDILNGYYRPDLSVEKKASLRLIIKHLLGYHNDRHLLRVAYQFLNNKDVLNDIQFVDFYTCSLEGLEFISNFVIIHPSPTALYDFATQLAYLKQCFIGEFQNAQMNEFIISKNNCFLSLEAKLYHIGEYVRGNFNPNLD